ncbi:HAMP domain-containing protein, partial [Paracraurococcus ruber]|uniref:HAMP domain-containing protein n=1 Tax=Paracraurococcus ruber TaxID=77675 RepID=UPI0010580A36
MSLGTAPAIARRLRWLALLLAALPALALALALLGPLRAEAATLPGGAGLLAALALGPALATLAAWEAMAFLAGRGLVRPAGLLAQLARDVAAGDLRRAPAPGAADEIGRLATALGRGIRHIARRRREL